MSALLPNGKFISTWFADMALRDGRKVVVVYGWDDSACIEDCWLKADENNIDAPSLPLTDCELERLQEILSERGNPAWENSD